jgi:hypothetical protein
LIEKTGTTEREVVREALRRQVWLGRLTALREYGGERAEACEIGPEDGEELVDELRGQ